MIGVKEALGLLGGLRYLSSAQLTSTKQMIRQMADLTESFRFAMQRALRLREALAMRLVRPCAAVLRILLDVSLLGKLERVSNGANRRVHLLVPAHSVNFFVSGKKLPRTFAAEENCGRRCRRRS